MIRHRNLWTAPTRRALRIGAVLGAAGYSWLAAGARAFSAPAGALQVLSYAVMALVAWRGLQRRRLLQHGPAWPGRDAIPIRAAQMSAWATAILLVVCFELVMYFSAPRRTHPTISSLYDELARAPAGRSLVFFAWLLLGWALVGQ